MGATLLVWLALVFLDDLGLLGASLALRPAPATMPAMLLIDPLQVFKLTANYSLRGTLDTLGPMGQFAYIASARHCRLLMALLVAWIMASFGLAYAIFSRRGDP